MSATTVDGVLLLPNGRVVQIRHAISLLSTIGHKRAMGDLKTLNELIRAGMLAEGRGLTDRGWRFIETHGEQLRQMRDSALGVKRD